MSAPSSRYRIARRAFLGGCVASPLLLPLLRNIEARAQGLPAPKRFLVIHHPLGTMIDKWRPTGVGATTTSYTLSTISAAFAPLQSKMVMIDGVNLVAATRVANGPTGDKTHEGGMVALMTGVPTLGKIGQQDHAAGGRSIDQIFLDGSPVLGGAASATQTPFGSLQLAADVRSDRDEVSPRVLSYRDPLPGETDISKARQPMYPETQPLNVYSRIFAGGLTGDALAQQASVLDFVRRDMNRMRTLIPASETAKLDMFATSIQQLESSLKGAICTTPEQPPSFTQSGKGATNGQFGNALAPAGGSALSGVDYYIPSDPDNHPHQQLGRLQLSMIKTAFACDLVRVATFMWSAGTNWVVFPGTFQGAAIGAGTSPTPHHPPSHTTAADVQAWLTQVDMWYAQQNAEFLQELAATTDSDGNNLLDNTVVCYVTEVARAWDHDWRNVPLLVFGGKNTGIKGGTFLKVTGGALPDVDGKTGNRPTNDVWLALAPIFGVDLPSLGASTQYQGPLPGLVAS